METVAARLHTGQNVLHRAVGTVSTSADPSPQFPVGQFDRSFDENDDAYETFDVETSVANDQYTEESKENENADEERETHMHNTDGNVHDPQFMRNAELRGAVSADAFSCDDQLTEVDQPDWNCTPHLVLVLVCRQLPLQDRLSLALACKTWADAFRDSRVWQTAFLPAHASERRDLQKTISLLRHTGCYIRSLVMTAAVFAHRDVCESIINALADLTLESLAVDLLYIPAEDQYADEVEERRLECQYGLYRALWQLPWTQPNIKRITIKHAHFTFDNALDVLRRIPSTLDALTLYNFIELDETDRRDLDQADERSLSEALKRFERVRKLGLNFSLLSDDFVRTLARNQRLRQLSVYAALIEEPETVAVESWQMLLSSCPDLEVTVTCTLDDVDSVLNAMALLASVQRVFGLHVDISHDEVSENLIAPFIEFVERECGQTLTEFCMSGHRVYDTDAELVSLVCRCSRLKRIALHRCVSTSFVETVCLLQRQKTTCLARFDVSVFQWDPFYSEEKLMSLQKTNPSLYCYNEQWILRPINE